MEKSEKEKKENAELALEIKKMIVESLNLEDIKPEDIETNAPLFGDGLGLDSIDALELGIAMKKKFGGAHEVRRDAARREGRVEVSRA